MIEIIERQTRAIEKSKPKLVMLAYDWLQGIEQPDALVVTPMKRKFTVMAGARGDKSTKFYQTKEFKQIQKEWSAKLKKDGFKDVETAADICKDNVNKIIIELDIERYKYFEECAYWLRYGEFRSAEERFIFRLHAGGLTRDEIVAKFKLIGAKPPSTGKISNIIEKICREAFIKKPLLK